MYQSQELENLHIIDHPIVQHKLSQLRAIDTQKAEFRRYLNEITQLMAYEITRNLKVSTCSVQTPVDHMQAPCLDEDWPVIVPILRAGLGMAEGLERIMPEAPMGHIGLCRDEETKKPVEYLVSLPRLERRSVIIVDPMLATGHSAAYATRLVLANGGEEERLQFLSLVSAPEGVQVYRDTYPDIPVYTAALDTRLNDKAFIVPGLGDAGDRMFGT